MLKVLEGESTQTLSNELQFFRERALPDLSNNIKCGNSLIGPDFYNQTEMNFLDDEEKLLINVFDWNKEFPQVFKPHPNPLLGKERELKGEVGFDVVIGNPPYVRIQAMKEWAKQEVEFYKTKYISASKGNYDLYIVFVEKSLELINKNGKIGFILPNKFLLTDYGQKLRLILVDGKIVDSIVDFGSEQIFKNATTYTCLLFLNKLDKDVILYTKISEPKTISDYPIEFNEIEYSSLSSATWLMSSDDETEIIQKLFNNSVELGQLPSKISRGSSTGNDNIFLLDEAEVRSFAIESDILTKPVFATDFNRYLFYPNNNFQLIFPYVLTNEKYLLIEENVLSIKFPNAYKYLISKKKELEKRKQYSKWYGYSAPRNLIEHSKAEILIPLLADKGLFAIFDRQEKKYTLMASGGFSILLLNSVINPFLVLGLINSKLIFWYLKKLSNDFRGGWITCTKQYFEKLPIKQNIAPNFSDTLTVLVKQHIVLKQKIQLSKTPTERTAIERQIQATDTQIDQLVYQLYGLTEEEIKIVEGKT